MHQISKEVIKNYILSLKNPQGGFFLQKQYNQSTLMSSAFSILSLELVNSLNHIDIKTEASQFLKNQDKESGLIIDPKLNFPLNNIEDLEKNYIHYQLSLIHISEPTRPY